MKLTSYLKSRHDDQLLYNLCLSRIIMFHRIEFKNRNFSFNKAPEQYDEYKSTLSEQFLEIAKRELGETKEVRESALREMREWIANNPNIISCRTDALFLLRFLRVCKFRVPAACKKLETYLKSFQQYPQWFKDVTIDEDNVRGLFEDGYIIPLPEKDASGRQVVFFQSHKLDTQKYTSRDIMRACELIFQLIMDDEETQVSGFMAIFEDTDLKMAHLTCFSLADMRNGLRFVSKGIPFRSRGWHRINFPAFGRVFHDFVVSFVGPKLRERFQMFRSVQECHDKILNKHILPREYDPEAKYTWKEINEAFIKLAELRKKEVLMQEENVILLKSSEDFEEPDQVIGELQGTFRKLNVD